MCATSSERGGISNAVKGGVVLKHHDWQYVERRGGIDLLTHLRGAADRADYRRSSISRAVDLFEAADGAGDCPDSEVGGLGLVVAQRALLAAEDLGGALHGLRQSDAWEGMRGASIDRIDDAFEWATSHPVEAMSKIFLLADQKTWEADGFDPGDVEILLRLRERTARRWTRMLENAMSVWFSLRQVAKAMMHGSPIWAGSLVFDPPGAGELSHGLAKSQYGRTAVVATSTEHQQDGHTEVRTERLVVRLDRPAVASYGRNGRVAARLYEEICTTQAESRMRGYGALVPFRLARTLSSSDQARLEQISQDQDG